MKKSDIKYLCFVCFQAGLNNYSSSEFEETFKEMWRRLNGLERVYKKP